MLILEQVANGIALGSIYSLLALGFTMVFGILFFINFPHGEVLMASIFMAWSLYRLGLPVWLIIVLTIVGTAVLAVLVEFVAYRRLRKVRRLAPLLSALGVSLVLANTAMLVFGPRTQSFPKLIDVSGIRIMAIPGVVWFIIITCIIVMGLLELFLRRTVTGMAIRAASESLTAAEIVGINPQYVISLTFGIGGALAAVGGILLAMRYGSFNSAIGVPLMLKAFAACVVGGIGNIYGAVIGSLIIGLAEVLTVSYFGSGWQDAGAFVVLVLVLLFRPSGLLGGRTEVRL